MRIEATLNLRNHRVLEARRKLGLTQQALADAAGVPVNIVTAIELMDFKRHGLTQQRIDAIALALELQPEHVVPSELMGTVIPSRFTKLADVDPSRIIGGGQDYHPEFAIDFADEIKALTSGLTKMEREVLNLRFMEVETLEEVARKFGVTRERVRQIEAKAVLKCQSKHSELAEPDPITPRLRAIDAKHIPSIRKKCKQTKPHAAASAD